MINERRQFPRVPIDVRVDSDNSAIGHTKDISEGGVCLISEKSFAEGKIVKLEFLLSAGEKEISVVGKVERSRKVSDNFYEIGMSFREIKKEDQESIRRHFAE